MAERFYAPDLDPQAGDYCLVGDECHHFRAVMRGGVGQTVELFNGQGLKAKAVVESIEKRQVYLLIQSTWQEPAPSAGLRLAIAFPKGERADWLVEKCTELGVTVITPLLCERSVVNPRDTKLDRLRRLVVEACKQSGRPWLLDLTEPVSFADWVEKACQPAFLLDVEGAEEWLLPTAGDLSLAIGPEGGWAPAEVELAKQRSMASQRLPGHVLRVETAALAIASWRQLQTPIPRRERQCSG